ncbi:H-NS histone family protein [Aquincola sp. S2]|uniref:H-NS histone family protein n=1 Tax=Pseudaquabacterium terrae TaxID=2732868 RepID=A0ABX2EM35_9BURK|nr:H-NS histone family protein [Aquabacterium terrae]NRF69637.1 H-NS histone family protein [Aquabacterium terrae]
MPLRRTLSPEQRAALARIQGLIEYWQITADEIDAAPEVALPASPVSAAARYRHPTSGETWDGRGEHPEWLRRALLTEGYRVSDIKLDG